MPDDPFESILENIYELIDEDQYEEALRLIECIPRHEERDPRLLVFKATCKYELEGDLPCLELLSRFLVQYPRHEKVNYSLFTSAICLVNLGMEEEALQILKQVSKGYPDLQSEMESVKKNLDVKQAARRIAREILRSRE